MLEVEAEDTKSPELGRKAAHRLRSEITAAVVTAHGMVSLSAVTTQVHNSGEEQAWACAVVERQHEGVTRQRW